MVTWGAWYWPLQFWVFVVSLAGPEIYALFTNAYNTQSYWVWRELDVTTDHTRPWTALHFLVLGIWIVVMSWLTIHYFWGRLR